MDFKQLQYFLGTAKTLNMSKAALELGVAQPALSRQIKDLENQIGRDLFIRHPRGLLLTEEGKQFQQDSETILHLFESAVQKVRDANASRAKTP